MLDREILTHNSPLKTKKDNLLSLIAHTLNPSTREAEVGKSLRVPGRPCVQSQFQVSHGYTVRFYLKTAKQNPKNQLTVHQVQNNKVSFALCTVLLLYKKALNIQERTDIKILTLLIST